MFFKYINNKIYNTINISINLCNDNNEKIKEIKIINNNLKKQYQSLQNELLFVALGSSKRNNVNNNNYNNDDDDTLSLSDSFIKI